MRARFAYGVAFLLSACIFIFHEKITLFLTSSFLDPQEIGRAEQVTGEVWRQNPLRNGISAVHNYTSLFSLDHISTSENSQLDLAFSTGGVVRLNAQSRATIELSQTKNSQILVHVISGNFKILKQVKSGTLRVLFNGVFYESDAPPTLEQEIQAKPGNDRERPTDQPLTRTEIQTAIGAQKNLFDNCYAAYLRKNLKASGRVQVAFSVNANGKVDEAKIHQSAIKDSTFEGCILQSFKRTYFRPFKGKTKKVIFPLNFGTY